MGNVALMGEVVLANGAPSMMMEEVLMVLMEEAALMERR